MFISRKSPPQMNSEDRDRLLRHAWGVSPPFADRVHRSYRTGPADRGPSDERFRHISAERSPTIGVRALAEEAPAWGVPRGRRRRDPLPPEKSPSVTPPGRRAGRSPGDFPQRCVLVSGHQWEDHHGVDDRRDPPRGQGRVTPQPSRGEHAGGGRPGPSSRSRGEIGVFEVDDDVVAGRGGRALPRGDRSRQPLPGPTRRVRGARCPGHDPGSGMSSPRAPGPGSSSTPTMRSSPACAGTAAGAPPHHLCFSGVEDRALVICQEAEYAVDSDPMRPPARAARIRYPPPQSPWVTTAATPAAPIGRTPEVFADPHPAGLRWGFGRRASSIDGLAGPVRDPIYEPPRPLQRLQRAGGDRHGSRARGRSSTISRALAAFFPVFGRGERLRAGTTDLLVLLMKNPAGANELLRTLSRDAAPTIDLLIALNDGLADGRDVSWIWDADFEALQRRVGRVVCTGNRAAGAGAAAQVRGLARLPDRGRHRDRERARSRDLGSRRTVDRPSHLLGATRAFSLEFALRVRARPALSGPGAPGPPGRSGVSVPAILGLSPPWIDLVTLPRPMTADDVAGPWRNGPQSALRAPLAVGGSTSEVGAVGPHSRPRSIASASPSGGVAAKAPRAVRPSVRTATSATRPEKCDVGE